MTEIVIETATIADAIRHAARVAPVVRGAAFDKAHGILISVMPDEDPPVLIHATDTNVFHREWITPIKAEGEVANWRVPSTLLERILAKLPIGQNRSVTFRDIQDKGHTKLEITFGRTLRVILNLLPADMYPDWETFSPDELSPVAALAQRLKMVEWAADRNKGNIILTGVHLDGEHAYATDRWRLSRIPCPIEHLTEPVTVPAGSLTPLLPDQATVDMAVEGHQLIVMPNEFTQIRITTLGDPYPSAGIKRIMIDEWEHFIEVDKNDLLALIDRASAVDEAGRNPLVRLYIGKGEVAAVGLSDEVGMLRDILEVEGQAAHSRTEYQFNPKNIIEAITNAPNSRIRIGYQATTPLKPLVYIEGGNGYQAWAARVADSVAGSGGN